MYKPHIEGSNELTASKLVTKLNFANGESHGELITISNYYKSIICSIKSYFQDEEIFYLPI